VGADVVTRIRIAMKSDEGNEVGGFVVGTSVGWTVGKCDGTKVGDADGK
jgi:hypothetical protein